MNKDYLIVALLFMVLSLQAEAMGYKRLGNVSLVMASLFVVVNLVEVTLYWLQRQK